ncbi:MAG: T9SS type A sorting domain-containing protein [Flavobacteriales bacterium]|nr:T9SS type A sorting domain-containing protein [Flavobacteriales bacterium]
MKKIIAAVIAASFSSLTLFAQVNHGGEPLNWGTETAVSIEFIRTPELDLEAIQTEDAENDQYKEFGYRFGIEHSANLNIETNGTWSIENDMNVWRLGVNAPQAKGVSFVFNEFNLPKSASLFIYDLEKTHFIGSFNHTNKQKNGMLATSLVYGENVVIELQIPVSQDLTELELSINQIVHAYRGLDSRFEELKALARGPFGNSGACNININCPEGDDWQVEKKSVALIASGGSAICTGALINNTANDGHPYFLTANHCLGGVANWVFYFNHESSTCGGNTGPTNQTVSGATVVASNAGSDFGLLEINGGNDIPASFNAEWAGWDNTDNLSSATSVTGIHHPSGDLKKVCHDTDGPVQNTQGGAEVWYIGEWEEGVTEGGSSGSPLFNQDHRIIGQLYGGGAACNGSTNNGQPDWYGRLGVSWDGNSSTTRLRDWLDPQNTGVTTLDGYPTGAVSYNLDAANNGLTGVPEVLCEAQSISPIFVLKNNGLTNLTSCTITYSYNGGNDQTIAWTGSLAQNATANVQLSDFTAALGTNTIDVSISAPNGQIDENVNNNSTSRSFELNVGEEVLNLTLRTDNYGYETYWELRGPNNQLVASGGNTEVGANGGGNQSAQAGDPGAYANNTTITETIQLVGDGCYTFLIVDDYGDGICCGFTGNGNYTLRDGNNTIMTQGDEFEEETESEFGMVGGLSVSEASLGIVRVYPNPTEGVLNIEVEKADDLNSISIVDVVGRTVAQLSVFGNTKTVINLNNLVDGVYHVNLNSDKGITSKKVVLLRD